MVNPYVKKLIRGRSNNINYNISTDYKLKTSVTNDYYHVKFDGLAINNTRPKKEDPVAFILDTIGGNKHHNYLKTKKSFIIDTTQFSNIYSVIGNSSSVVELNKSNLSPVSSQKSLQIGTKLNQEYTEESPNISRVSRQDSLLSVTDSNWGYIRYSPNVSPTSSEDYLLLKNEMNHKTLQSNHKIHICSSENSLNLSPITSHESLQSREEHKMSETRHNSNLSTNYKLSVENICRSSTQSIIFSRESRLLYDKLNVVKNVHNPEPSSALSLESLILHKKSVNEINIAEKEYSVTLPSCSSRESRSSHTELSVIYFNQNPSQLSASSRDESTVADTELKTKISDNTPKPEPVSYEELHLTLAELKKTLEECRLPKHMYHNQQQTTSIPEPYTYRSGENSFDEGKEILPILLEVGNLECSKLVYNLITGKFNLPAPNLHEKRASVLDSTCVEALNKLISGKFDIPKSYADRKAILRNTFDENIHQFDDIDSFLSNISESMHEVHNFFHTDKFKIIE